MAIELSLCKVISKKILKLLLIKCGSRKVTKDVIIRQKGSKMSKFGKIPANLTSTIEGVFRIGLKFSFIIKQVSLG